MRPLIIALSVVLIGVVILAVWVFTREQPKLPGGPKELSAEQVRVIAMRSLQKATAAEMRLFIAEGEFTDQAGDLDGIGNLVRDPGIPEGGRIGAEVCEGGSVVVLATRALEGTALAVKVRGLEPASAGDSEISHYTEDPECDPSRGPETWPGGYAVTRGGLMKGGEPAEEVLA